MSKQRTIVVTAGIMMSLFMASMEATVIATAMPTIVSQLGGLSIYSWVFAIYMLASTTMVPVFGKLSDIYGRRPVYAASIGLFLVGSVLCGLAQNMPMLIAARGVQGLGAGGILPLAFTIVGDMFSFEQRAKIQGLFSGVWGVSSVIGPLVGGFIVDQVAWPWIFYINIVPGLLAAGLVLGGWVDRPRLPRDQRPAIDFAGAALLSTGVVALLLGLFELGTPLSWGLLLTAALLLAALVQVERRAADPIVPLHLFHDRLFAVACAQGALAGWTLFGSLAFIPLFVQAVLGTSATGAGSTLTPLLLSWVAASIIGGRLLLRYSYRNLALLGMASLTTGTFLLTLVTATTPQWRLLFDLSLMGIGMGLSIPAFLIAVQSTVQRGDLGTATSTLQFSRSIGGTLGTSVMGAVLSMQLASQLLAVGLDPAAVSVNELLEPATAGADLVNGPLRAALAGAMQSVFVLAFVAAVIGLAVTFLAPQREIQRSSVPAAAPAAAPAQSTD